MVFSFLFEFLFYLSLRLGHTRGLTVHWTVIQYPRAASLRLLARRMPIRLTLANEDFCSKSNKPRKLLRTKNSAVDVFTIHKALILLNS